MKIASIPYISTNDIFESDNAKTNQINSSMDNFTNFFINSINDLNSQYAELDEAQIQFAQGDIEAHELMTVLRETELMMKTASTIRNKMLDAYKEVTNMQI